MLVSDFDFELPDELVAQHPAPRGGSRLLVLDRRTGAVEHSTIAALPRHLQRGDLLVVNDTRVFSARLIGRRVPSGGRVECLLLSAAASQLGESEAAAFRPLDKPRTGWSAGEGCDEHGPLEQNGLARRAPRTAACRTGLYSALMHPGQKLREGSVVRFEGKAGVLMGEVVARHFHGRRTIRLWSGSGASVDELVDALGHIPLPPYIRRADTPVDRSRYQTVYARARGSVAAPTAGLHFTPELLDELTREGVERVSITLHVGYGTFKPVRAATVEEHTVDAEWYEVTPAVAAQLQRARREGRRVVAVGTTTTRALEDSALRGLGTVVSGEAQATVYIYPGFQFRVVDALLTNFHLPRSSLLMLVCAFFGREHVLAAYREAIAARYRFYSYGDAMLIV